MIPHDVPSLSYSKLGRKANSYKKELLSRLLTSRHCASRKPFLSKVFRKEETSARERFEEANLVGIGYGVKETDGTLTGDVAVRVYVTKKLPKAAVPRRVWVPATVNGCATDVIAVGQLRFQGRPAHVGGSVSHLQGGAGSIGCVLTKLDDNAWYLLSASHVFVPAGNGAVGDLIVEPARGADAIANLTDFEPLQLGGVANYFDAGIARVIRKTDMKLEIPIIGPLLPEVMAPILFQSVRKYGAATAHTLGIVTDIAADVRFTDQGEEFLFSDVVEVTGIGGAFTKGGDSGALVVDGMSSRPAGLIIGGADGDPRTYVSPLEKILTRFNARIAQ